MSMFKREKSEAEILPKSRKTLTLRGTMTRSVIYEDFRVSVLLKDDRDCFVSKGYVEWVNETKDYLSWYDRCVCYIIEGECGFAAVYYCIFSNAAQVEIKVILSKTNHNEVTTKVWGDIGTQYKKYQYSTYYDREYYRSMLFKENSEIPVCLNGKSEAVLPLSRGVIAAPLDCALVVSLDLVVVDSNGVDGGVVQDLLVFEPFCDYPRSIQANGFDIMVRAEWKLPPI